MVAYETVGFHYLEVPGISVCFTRKNQHTPDMDKTIADAMRRVSWFESIPKANRDETLGLECMIDTIDQDGAIQFVASPARLLAEGSKHLEWLKHEFPDIEILPGEKLKERILVLRDTDMIKCKLVFGFDK